MSGCGTWSAAKTLTPTQVRQLGDAVTLVDVREDGEWASGHIAGAVHIPLGRLREEMDRIPSGKPVVFYCHAGGRSSQAIAVAMAAGQAHDTHMGGGISAWRGQGFPSAA
ncbi:rhodanese-like domain-containing protein [Mesorhizobium sp. M7A.F.Ca.US.011.01.1.1]|uniref:rhodanese-like domain-containing protein n=1 Tax=Mesorhizobium sp. M7A.F.Ca.US.011.01.1.1 TaxID=2496741 RepID=UPI000FCC0C6C|nr:rhodanese-like domain-containing protein [Mesorhizobium sp. M7A.F.Ca.US.011.01.1.1]RUX28772.1 rhodanese-like domain-containing protein [Mesorhizobium sp. M7A.F.Ca.US.011.01.1.1]